jgi:hypothetical protein
MTPQRLDRAADRRRRRRPEPVAPVASALPPWREGWGVLTRFTGPQAAERAWLDHFDARGGSVRYDWRSRSVAYYVPPPSDGRAFGLMADLSREERRAVERVATGREAAP